MTYQTLKARTNKAIDHLASAEERLLVTLPADADYSFEMATSEAIVLLRKAIDVLNVELATSKRSEGIGKYRPLTPRAR